MMKCFFLLLGIITISTVFGLDDLSKKVEISPKQLEMIKKMEDHINAKKALSQTINQTTPIKINIETKQAIEEPIDRKKLRQDCRTLLQMDKCFEYGKLLVSEKKYYEALDYFGGACSRKIKDACKEKELTLNKLIPEKSVVIPWAEQLDLHSKDEIVSPRGLFYNKGHFTDQHPYFEKLSPHYIAVDAGATWIVHLPKEISDNNFYKSRQVQIRCRAIGIQIYKNGDKNYHCDFLGIVWLGI